MKLFPDQEELINNVREKLVEGNKSVLIQAGTGSGKTIVASTIVKSAFEKRKNVLFVVPRIDLIRQTSNTFHAFNIPHGFIASGRYYNQRENIFIASKDTLIRKYESIKKKFDLCIFDEAHFGGDGLNELIQFYKPNSTLLGLTASPWDMEGRGMAHQYNTMVCGKSIRWLIDNNRLSRYKAYAPSHLDLSQIGMVAGDFNKKQLAEKMEADVLLMGDTVNHYKNHAMGKRGVTFCVRRKHSEMMAAAYRDAGVMAVHMDGDTPDEVRVKIAKAFAKGEIQQICNCDLLTFGYDLASISESNACVECLSDCQPTKSLAKQLQKWGRNLRYDGTEHVFFDHANNFETHGLPCDEREWTLEPREKKRRSSEKERSIPVKQCPKCFYVHSPSKSCPECGYIYPIQERSVEEIDVSLQEIDLTLERKEKRMEQGRAKTFDDLWKIANERGYKAGWVYKQAQLKGIRA
jgi:DNA repair protein RadD